MRDGIQHVIVLMLENRSFDQMLGDIPKVDGVNPKYRNVLNGDVYKQNPEARNETKFDPKHLHPNVRFQIANSGANYLRDYWCEYENGPRRRHQSSPRPNYGDIMDYFSHKSINRLNALHTLATTFTVCDKWFSSVPGPTWPNRFFVHSGTSMGYVCMPESPWLWQHFHLYKYNQKTIYRQLTQANVSWKIYYHDVPQSLLLRDLRKSADRFEPIGAFFEDVAGNPDEFPQYSFIEPRYGYGVLGAAFAVTRPLMAWQFRNVTPDPTKQPNDDHPPHNVNEGQDLITDIYHALIENERLWASTLDCPL